MSGALVWEQLWRHAATLGCVTARMAPCAFLCPALGGRFVPVSVKLVTVLSLGLALTFEGGVTVGSSLAPLALGGALVRESGLGLALGLLAALPYEAARMAGRWIDTFRGAAADVSLPGVGSPEAASGELLHQLTLALAAGSFALPLFIAALWRSFARLPVGTFIPSESSVMQLMGAVSQAMTLGLSLGAPIAAVCLALDGAVTLVVRASSALGFAEAAAPLRLWGGSALLWLILGVLQSRLLSTLEELPSTLTAWLGALR